MLASTEYHLNYSILENRTTVFTGFLFIFDNLFVIQSASLIKAQTFNYITAPLVPLLCTDVFFINRSKLISVHTEQLCERLSRFSVTVLNLQRTSPTQTCPRHRRFYFLSFILLFQGVSSPGHHDMKTSTRLEVTGLQVELSSSAAATIHSGCTETKFYLWNEFLSQRYLCYNRG